MGAVTMMGWDADAKVWRKVLVNAEGKLIIDPSEIFEDPPTENEAGKAPQSAWAFDHAADASAHHTKFTVTEHDTADRHPLANLDTLVCSDDEADSKITAHKGDASAHHDEHLTLTEEYHLWVGTDLLSTYKSGLTCDYVYANEEWPNYGACFTCRGTLGTTNWGGFQIWCPAGASYGGSFAKIRWGDYDTGAWTAWKDLAPDVAGMIMTHKNDASAHHTRYTDAEVLAARYANRLTVTTGTITAQDVAGKGMLILDTTDGNISLKGLDGGAEGQMIFCLKPVSANSVTVYNASGDAAVGDKILTTTAADQTIAAVSLRCFWLVYYGGYWRVDSNITI